MTCSDVERILPEFLDGAPEGAFPDDFETHVKSCPACSDLVSDLKLIQSEARHLAASEEPAPRVWVRIAAELRAEGLIREPESTPARPVLVPTYTRRRWNAWWMAPVAAAILAAGSYMVSHKTVAPPVAKQQAPVPNPKQTAPAPVVAEAAVTPAVAPSHTATAPASAVPQLAQNTAPKKGTREARRTRLRSRGSTVPQRRFHAFPVDAGHLRKSASGTQCRIQETQAYVNQNPGDPDARQHLMDAYQQKALLYQIALDRIQ